MTDAGPGVVQSLLAELEAGGELVDAGGFSFDGSQARKKLQSFQLADPHTYGRRVGLGGFRLVSQARAEALILTNGVLAERIHLPKEPAWAPNFAAVVELDLAKDLSQTQLVRGPKFDGVIAAIRAAHDGKSSARWVRHARSKQDSNG